APATALALAAPMPRPPPVTNAVLVPFAFMQMLCVSPPAASSPHVPNSALPIVPYPGKPGRGAARLDAGMRTVLATDPAVVSATVQHAEQIPVIDLADIRLVPLGHACNLNVTNTAGGHIVAHFDGEVAFHDLTVIQVHLDLEV